MEQVIVDRSFGRTMVYHATIANAKKILGYHINQISPEAIEIVKTNKKVLSKESIGKVIDSILTEKEGSQALKNIEINKTNKQEIVMYCFENKINIKNNKIDQYEFFKKFKITDFSFFASYDKEAELVDEYIIQQAYSYQIIKDDNWDEDDSEYSKIYYIIEFAQSLSHRDIKYEMTEIREEV